MGRGADTSTQQASDQARAQIDALNQQFLGQQSQLANLLLPQYQQILANPGLSAADKAAVTANSQGALASAFGALQQAAQNRVARTRNSAGFGELADELARQQGMQQAGVAQSNELNFSNAAFQRQMAALEARCRSVQNTQQAVQFYKEMYWATYRENIYPTYRLLQDKAIAMALKHDPSLQSYANELCRSIEETYLVL